MKYLRGFVLFWYDFIVGDDWRVAVGVIAALAATAGLAAVDIPEVAAAGGGAGAAQPLAMARDASYAVSDHRA